MPKAIFSDRTILRLAEHMANHYTLSVISDMLVDNDFTSFDEIRAINSPPKSKKDVCKIIFNEANHNTYNDMKFLKFLKNIDLAHDENLKSSLELDGWDMKDLGVQSLAAPFINPAEEESELITKLKNYGMTPVVSCFQQSLDNYSRNQFESSNAITRTALETLIKSISEQRATSRGETITVARPAFGLQPADYRNYLKDSAFLTQEEYDLLKVFYGYSSSNGSHPGVSSENDSRLRRFMTIAICLSYLYKLDLSL